MFRKRGFSLIELIAVVVVLAILALLASSTYAYIQQRTVEEVAESTAESIWQGAQALAAFGDGMSINGVVVPDVEIGGVITDVILQEVVDTLILPGTEVSGLVIVAFDVGTAAEDDGLITGTVTTSSGDEASFTIDGANNRTLTFTAGGSAPPAPPPPAASGTLWASGTKKAIGVGTASWSNATALSLMDTGLTNVVQVEAANNFAAAVKADGTLWVTGVDLNGQFGLGAPSYKSSWVPVPGMTGVDQISVSHQTIAVVKTDGTLWVAGANAYGNLGLGDTAQRNTFTQVPGMTGVVSASVTYGVSTLVKSDGTLWAAGKNDAGQLGLGGTTNVTMFTQVPGMTNMVQTVASFNTAWALDSSGLPWAVGSNANRMLTNLTSTVVPLTSWQTRGISGVAELWQMVAIDRTAMRAVSNLVFMAGNTTYGEIPAGGVNVAGYGGSWEASPGTTPVKVSSAGQATVLLDTNGTPWFAGQLVGGIYPDGTGVEPLPRGFWYGIPAITDGLDVAIVGGPSGTFNAFYIIRSGA